MIKVWNCHNHSVRTSLFSFLAYKDNDNYKKSFYFWHCNLFSFHIYYFLPNFKHNIFFKMYCCTYEYIILCTG